MSSFDYQFLNTIFGIGQTFVSLTVNIFFIVITFTVIRTRRPDVFSWMFIPAFIFLICNLFWGVLFPVVMNLMDPENFILFSIFWNSIIALVSAGAWIILIFGIIKLVKPSKSL